MFQQVAEIGVRVRDATQSPGKSPIFSPLKIGGGRGVNPDLGKLRLKIATVVTELRIGQLGTLNFSKIIVSVVHHGARCGLVVHIAA